MLPRSISAQVTAEEAILELATEKALAVIREAAVVEAKSRQEAAEEQRRQQGAFFFCDPHIVQVLG